jgi:hypothetical protein
VVGLCGRSTHFIAVRKEREREKERERKKQKRDRKRDLDKIQLHKGMAAVIYFFQEDHTS